MCNKIIKMFAFSVLSYIRHPIKHLSIYFKAILPAVILFTYYYLKDLGYTQQTFGHFIPY